MATCQVCGNVTANRKIVDHIIARKIAPELAMDADNLWVLCFQCHNIKTRIEAEKVRKRRGKQLRSFGRNWWKNVIKARLWADNTPALNQVGKTGWHGGIFSLKLNLLKFFRIST